MFIEFDEAKLTTDTREVAGREMTFHKQTGYLWPNGAKYPLKINVPVKGMDGGGLTKPHAVGKYDVDESKLYQVDKYGNAGLSYDWPLTVKK